MKHNLKITLTIIAMFLVAQFIGLAVIHSYDANFGKSAQKAREEAIEKNLSLPPQPEMSFVNSTVPPKVELKGTLDIAKIVMSIVVAIIVAFVIFLLLSHVRTTILLRVWFAFVVFICLTLAFSLIFYPIAPAAFLSLFGKKVLLAEAIAFLLAALLTYYKIVRRNILVHNFTELFIYSGLAVIFLPLLNWIAAAVLLVAISIYDMIAVWKTKHMIKMAKFQIKHLKIFTGFFVPYINAKDKIKIQKMRALAQVRKGKEKSKGKPKKLKNMRIRAEIAILGGGDIAFSLIFAGTILLSFGLLAAIITTFCTTLALALLLIFAKKKPYPAMPFLTAGCFLGLAIVLLLL